MIKKLRLWEDPRSVGDAGNRALWELTLLINIFPGYHLNGPLPSDADRLKQALKVFKKELGGGSGWPCLRARDRGTGVREIPISPPKRRMKSQTHTTTCNERPRPMLRAKRAIG